MEMEGHSQKGPHSVEAYLRETAVANPHVTITYQDPHGEQIRFERSTCELPPRPKEIKPHPHGIELGRLIQMLNSTKSRTLLRFLVDEFSRVGKKTAQQIIAHAGKRLSDRSYPRHIAHAQATALHKALQKTRVAAPPTDCIVPIGEAQLLQGLRKELEANFYTVVTRPAAAYRGNPFQVEIALAYGSAGAAVIEVDASGHMRKSEAHQNDGLLAHKDQPIRLLRFANRVPLLYQQSSCAIAKAVTQTNWRAYGLHQPKGALPLAPMAILVHVASVWVPYTSESKEAIAPYPEILKEIRLGLQYCARKLAHYLSRDRQLRQEFDRRTHIERYLPHIGIALQDILALSDAERDATVNKLDDVLHESRTSRRREK
jgi:DNA topoisomerase-6 subunit B